MSESIIRSIVRAERAEGRADAIGPCGICSSRVDVSQTADGPRCYEHIGGPEAVVEADHVAGVANIAGLTIALSGNAHRRLEMLRSALGMDAWPVADGEPALVIAHLLGGTATLQWLAADWLISIESARREGRELPECPFR